jgi:hypothetical protein
MSCPDFSDEVRINFYYTLLHLEKKSAYCYTIVVNLKEVFL